jgi:hypothetical protein
MGIERVAERRQLTASLGRRLLWFAGLWAASVAVCGALAWALRWLLQL